MVIPTLDYNFSKWVKVIPNVTKKIDAALDAGQQDLNLVKALKMFKKDYKKHFESIKETKRVGHALPRVRTRWQIRAYELKNNSKAQYLVPLKFGTFGL